MLDQGVDPPTEGGGGAGGEQRGDNGRIKDWGDWEKK